MRRAERTEETEVLIRRLDVLERLCRSPAHIRDLVDETDQSRSTIKRSIGELEEIALVTRGDEGIEATVAGRLARDRLDSFLRAYDDVLTAEAVLDPLAPSVDIEPAVVADGEAMLATGPIPYRPLERIHDDLADATTYRALVPALEDPRSVRLLYEHVITDGNRAELVVAPAVFESLRQEFPRRLAAMAEGKGFSVLVGSVPPYGLGLLEDDRATGSTSSAETVHLVVLNESGGVHGALVNESASASSWADARYEAARKTATDRTQELIADTDGGVQSVDAVVGDASTGQSLPVSLEREGFVGVDGSFFREEPVADPATAWRAGLSLAEVHTGYAITWSHSRTGDRPWSARTDPTGNGECDEEGDRPVGSECGVNGERDTVDTSPADDARCTADVRLADDAPCTADVRPAEDETELVAAVGAELAAGTNCLIVGPPGAGKSTVCKQVACGWYDADRGPVIYREQDRGRSFSSVDDLVATVTGTDGHALVVVEDAVRPDASAVFDAIERVGDRDDVSFVLDARESEWRTFVDRSAERSELAVRRVPRLREDDCERLVEHFERTIGKPVDVSAERLWSAVHDDVAGGSETGTNVLLRLIHRLATYADPLAEGPTALEEAVTSVADALADDELALSVGVLANVLNAAGVDFDRSLLYAVADSDEFDVVDDAIDRLEGRVLFPSGDGGYRTVHEEWSTTFLVQVVDAYGEQTAAHRFGAAVSALVALADCPDRCRAIERHLEDSGALAVVVDEPTTWADETVEAIYGVGRRRSQLTPLFDDGDRATIEPPAACSAATVGEIPVWLGRLALAGGYYDRAERAFDETSDETLGGACERLLGLARISTERGEYDDALVRCERSLSMIEEARADRSAVEESGGREPTTEADTVNEPTIEADPEVLRARVRLRMGAVLVERGEYADAEPNLESALEVFRAGGLRGWEARTRHHLGSLAANQGAFDRATDCYESSLQLNRELGDRRGQAECLSYLGNLAWKRGNVDRAATLFERSLEYRRERGDRSGVAATLTSLGAIEGKRGQYDRAADLYERGLEYRQELGDRQGVAKSLHNLGHLASQRENFDRAVSFYERSLDRKRELGDNHLLVSTLNNLGTVEGRRGNFSRAAELHERSLAINRELGDSHSEAFNLHNLGQISYRHGSFDAAAERHEQCVEIMESLDNRPGTAPSLCALGMIAARRGEYERGREYCRRSLEIAERGEDAEQRAESLLGLGEISLRSGDYDRAGDHLDAAHEAAGSDTELLGVQIRLTSARLALARGETERAKSLATAVRPDAVALDATYWIGRTDDLLGRIESAAGEDEPARCHLLDALDTFESLDAFHDALSTLTALVEMVDETDEVLDELRERARSLVAGAPEEVRERHPDWE